MAKRLTYPPEFRRRIIDLVRFGRSVNSVAAEFQVARRSFIEGIAFERSKKLAGIDFETVAPAQEHASAER